jgi:MFS transporter, DHA1 family, multidrug resistance protein
VNDIGVKDDESGQDTNINWQRTLWIMFISQLLSAVGFSMIFPFLPSYVHSLGSGLGINLVFLSGAVFSGQAITMAISSPIWGTIADRFGKKRMVERAMFGGSLILLSMAFAVNAEMLVILRTIQGLISGTVAAANALVAATAPRERAGYAMGVLQTGVWSGVALGPMLGGLVADAYGYAVSFYFTAGLLFLGGLLVHFGITDVKTNRSKPKGFIADWKHVLVAPGVNYVFFIRFIGWLGRNILVPYLPLFMATLIVSESGLNTLTGLAIGLSSAAGTVTSFFLGRVGDRHGHKRVLVICALLTTVLYILQIWTVDIWQLIFLQTLTGAAAGGIMPVLSALLNLYISPGEEGAAYGLDNSMSSLARAVAPMVGAVVVYLSSYQGLFLAAAVLFGLTAVLAFWKLPKVGEKLKGEG